MKKTIAFILAAALFLCGCSQYNTPDVSELMDNLITSQGLVNMTEASESDIDVLFDIDMEKVMEYSVKYSGKGGYADMIAIFRLTGDGDPDEVKRELLDYKKRRYEDFKGYAPLEAEKVENGCVVVYDSYVILMIVPDIDSAALDIDTEFTK